MMPILTYFYGISHSYGVAIIMLTTIVRLAILPLNFKQAKVQQDMQRLQPKLKELQAKHKDNPQELNQAMMALYQEHKVNPLGGCLPLLIQMPFMIALYGTLIGTKFQQEVGHQGFLFIRDLTQVGFYPRWHAPAALDLSFFNYLTTGQVYWDSIIMIVLFAVTTFITQKLMMTDPNDPMQQQMLYTMPPMITFMFVMIPLPAGILLYSVFSNFFTLGQSLLIKRIYPNQPVSAAPAAQATIDVTPKPLSPKGSGKATKKGS